MAALHEFLIEEVTELLGVRRVLLVLADADGAAGMRVAGAHLPEGEAAVPLLEAITPWLAEGRQIGRTQRRHPPDSADQIDQRR